MSVGWSPLREEIEDAEVQLTTRPRTAANISLAHSFESEARRHRGLAISRARSRSSPRDVPVFRGSYGPVARPGQAVKVEERVRP